MMNADQHHICKRILHAVTNNLPLLIFIDAPAGCGKTYIINAICYLLRSQNHIVLPTATTALAASNYIGGQTAHSIYRIPVQDRSSLLTSLVSLKSMRADLLRTADLHIFDEAPMANKAVCIIYLSYQC